MSHFFDELYGAAVHRDLEIAAYVGRLMNSIGCTATDGRRHAEALNAIGSDFALDLMRTARRNRMRIREWRGPVPYMHLVQNAIHGHLPPAVDISDEDVI